MKLLLLIHTGQKSRKLITPADPPKKIRGNFNAGKYQIPAKIFFELLKIRESVAEIDTFLVTFAYCVLQILACGNPLLQHPLYSLYSL